MHDISKHEIDSLFDKYPPNIWIKIVYKYFSEETDKKNIVVKNRFKYIFVFLFMIGFFLTAFDASRSLIMVVTLLYSFMLVGLVFFIYVGVLLNNKRIKKIVNELGITINKFNDIVEKYY